MSRHTRLIAARILRQASKGRTAACGPRLAIVAGPDTGRVLPVAGGDVLGRGAGAQLRLRDQATSRAHLRLEEAAGELAIVDLGSKNGVELNGRRVRSRAPVRNGDRVRVGATVLEVAGLEVAGLEVAGLEDAIASPSPSAIAEGASPVAPGGEAPSKRECAGSGSGGSRSGGSRSGGSRSGGGRSGGGRSRKGRWGGADSAGPRLLRAAAALLLTAGAALVAAGL